MRDIQHDENGVCTMMTRNIRAESHPIKFKETSVSEEPRDHGFVSESPKHRSIPRQ